MTEFQTKLHEAIQQAQTKATARAQEARKVLETLGDRVQADLKVFRAFAQKGSREQLSILGVELEKLGKRLQEVAARMETKANSGAPAHPN